MDLLEALSRRDAVRHITTRHEQGAAFMADVYGRLTGRAAVAMATLGPGATNLLTGIADAFLDRAPIVAITGQASSDKLHKEAHQLVDIVEMFQPVTKWNHRVERPDVDPRDRAQGVPAWRRWRSPGPTHIELPENIAAAAVDRRRIRPARARQAGLPRADATQAIAHAAATDHGVRTARSSSPATASCGGARRPSCGRFARGLHVPVAATFMGKGAIDDRSHLSLMAVGLQARDHVLTGFDRADLVISVGYDLVEYAPEHWNPDGRKRIIHIDTTAGRGGRGVPPEVELIGDIEGSLERLLRAVLPRGVGGRDATERHESRETLVNADLRTGAARRAARARGGRRLADHAAARDLRPARARSGPSDIVVTDVGAHKIWVARLFPTYEPNTVIISNGFASMGISLPGRDRRVARPPGRGRSSRCAATARS